MYIWEKKPDLIKISASLVYTFVVANLVSQYDHAFSKQLVLKVLGEEGAQLRLQQLPTKQTGISL